MPFASGENVGPYRITEQLGQGGMATVFKAYHAALDRFVAIKVLHPAFKEDPNFIKRFQREARLVAKLEHPNIVPIFDYAEHDGQPYLVMKYIDGITLKARLQQGPLTRKEGVSIAKAVGEALAYAHKQGILHRDVKPSNILLDPEGQIRLTDFGLARIAAAGTSTLSTDTLLGTPQYISPEQAKGERDLDEGTDIYSFGILLYEMVVGKVPFNADTPFSIIHDHIYTPLPLPRVLNPHVPEAVERVLLKALAKDRSDRFASIEEMMKGFFAALGVEGEAAASEPLARVEISAPSAFEEPPLPSPPWTDPATATSIAPEAPAVSSEVFAAEAPKKTPQSLPWMAVGITIGCIVLVVLAVLAYRIWRPGGRSGAELEATPMTAVAAFPSVADARATMQANPDDPQAHLSLAQALMRDGYPGLAVVELLRSADLYLENDRYYAAARAILSFLQRPGGPEKADPEVQDLLTQALWLGAGEPRVVSLIEDLQSTYPEWDRLGPLSARVSLLDEDLGTARRLLEGALAENPDDPFALAAMAEVYLMEGKKRLAEEIESRLVEAPDIPSWLLLELQAFSAGLQNG